MERFPVLPSTMLPVDAPAVDPGGVDLSISVELDVIHVEVERDGDPIPESVPRAG